MNRYLPIIMVTGHDKREEVIEALQAGVDEYLVKPVSYEVLEEKIKHLLGIRIRQAGPEDAETLARLIVEFADDEQHKAAPDVAALRRHLALTANPGCAALLAEHEACGQVIGFALYFHPYATFLTCWGIYLEDLYVKPTLPEIRNPNIEIRNNVQNLNNRNPKRVWSLWILIFGFDFGFRYSDSGFRCRSTAGNPGSGRTGPVA
ncbi:MAG: hypothetical protein IH820_18515 [Bacteroidetes bacterium]|nr:hypothetical protein [Bacteroidota bacterium]